MEKIHKLYLDNTDPQGDSSVKGKQPHQDARGSRKSGDKSDKVIRQQNQQSGSNNAKKPRRRGKRNAKHIEKWSQMVAARKGEQAEKKRRKLEEGKKQISNGFLDPAMIRTYDVQPHTSHDALERQTKLSATADVCNPSPLQEIKASGSKSGDNTIKGIGLSATVSQILTAEITNDIKQEVSATIGDFQSVINWTCSYLANQIDSNIERRSGAVAAKKSLLPVNSFNQENQHSQRDDPSDILVSEKPDILPVKPVPVCFQKTQVQATPNVVYGRRMTNANILNTVPPISRKFVSPTWPAGSVPTKTVERTATSTRLTNPPIPNPEARDRRQLLSTPVRASLKKAPKIGIMGKAEGTREIIDVDTYNFGSLSSMQAHPKQNIINCLLALMFKANREHPGWLSSSDIDVIFTHLSLRPPPNISLQDTSFLLRYRQIPKHYSAMEDKSIKYIIFIWFLKDHHHWRTVLIIKEMRTILYFDCRSSLTYIPSIDYSEIANFLLTNDKDSAAKWRHREIFWRPKNDGSSCGPSSVMYAEAIIDIIGQVKPFRKPGQMLLRQNYIDLIIGKNPDLLPILEDTVSQWKSSNQALLSVEAMDRSMEVLNLNWICRSNAKSGTNFREFNLSQYLVNIPMKSVESAAKKLTPGSSVLTSPSSKSLTCSPSISSDLIPNSSKSSDTVNFPFPSSPSVSDLRRQCTASSLLAQDQIDPSQKLPDLRIQSFSRPTADAESRIRAKPVAHGKAYARDEPLSSGVEYHPPKQRFLVPRKHQISSEVMEVLKQEIGNIDVICRFSPNEGDDPDPDVHLERAQMVVQDFHTNFLAYGSAVPRVKLHLLNQFSCQQPIPTPGSMYGKHLDKLDHTGEAKFSRGIGDGNIGDAKILLLRGVEALSVVSTMWFDFYLSVQHLNIVIVVDHQLLAKVRQDIWHQTSYSQFLVFRLKDFAQLLNGIATTIEAEEFGERLSYSLLARKALPESISRGRNGDRIEQLGKILQGTTCCKICKDFLAYGHVAAAQALREHLARSHCRDRVKARSELICNVPGCTYLECFARKTSLEKHIFIHMSYLEIDGRNARDIYNDSLPPKCRPGGAKTTQHEEYPYKCALTCYAGARHHRFKTEDGLLLHYRFFHPWKWTKLINERVPGMAITGKVKSNLLEDTETEIAWHLDNKAMADELIASCHRLWSDDFGTELGSQSDTQSPLILRKHSRA